MPFSPLLLTDCVVEIGGVDYATEISQALFNPNAAVQRFRGLKPTSNHKTYTTDWSLDLTYAQDWDSTASLSRYLYDHEGETVTGVTFKPKSGSGPSFTVDIIVPPGAIGGTVETHATTTVTVGCLAKPVLVPPTP